MTKVKTVKKVNALKKRSERMLESAKPKEDILYVAGYFHRGKNKGKKITIQVNNSKLLNPVEPIFENFPEIDVVIVGKDAKMVRKYFKALI